MKKVVFFAFKGNPMCFIHVMLNTLDMQEKGYDVRVVLEGEAVKLIQELDENPLFKKTIPHIDCVCRACSAKMKVLDYNQTSQIPVCGDMDGHPSMTKYIDQGYEIITM